MINKFAYPPEFIEKSGGRIFNPDWLLVQRVLREARERISRAKDPAAYERAVITAELQRMKTISRDGARRGAGSLGDNAEGESPAAPPLILDSRGRERRRLDPEWMSVEARKVLDNARERRARERR